MVDGDNNLLETLYVASGQDIENVTSNRSDEQVPEGTQIIVKSDSTTE